ncbi:MAG: HD domain-containing protein [Betaproteobacteria bacterium]|nr:MAG: HD domain-containing protein [Betaproteobacteria bacterium]
MEKLKKYLLQNFEQLFVLLVLGATVTINYFIPQKTAFLNFYFLPIILGGYYLGPRRAVLGAILCVILVSAYVLLNHEAFVIEQTEMNTYLHIMVWAGFLVLAGAVVGRLQERLAGEVSVTRELNQSLGDSQAALEAANNSLRESNQNLEERVRDRTFELEESKQALEGLKKKVENALYTTMDSSVVNLMIEGRLRSEKRNMSVMFTDLVGFTTYSESTPPESVVTDLNRFLHDMEPVLFAYRGHIDKYMGDGIMCEFGAPLDYQTHRLMAVVAAVKMQEKLGEHKHPWQMRIGIASGSAIAGLIGTRRQTYTAIGDIVNLAARLEQFCAPGRVLIDRYTHEDVAHFFNTRKLRALPTKEKVDLAKEHQLDLLYAEVAAAPDDADLHFRLGKLHLDMEEPMEALGYIERALQLDPRNTAFKVAYAEAGMKLKEYEKISVKGKRQRVEAFEVVGMKDPLDDRSKLPRGLPHVYRQMVDEILIPNDVTLPSEVLDGSLLHSRVVATLAYAIADIMDLPERDKLQILQAGALADIGKEVIPQHVLNRRGTLTRSEFELVKQHPEEACRIMRKMGYETPAVLEMVRHSHERYDGSGYPAGLRGDAIPVGSRIIAVADAYDALTSWRQYREPWQSAAALGEIRSETEKGVFDPAFVAVLDRLVG